MCVDYLIKKTNYFLTSKCNCTCRNVDKSSNFLKMEKKRKILKICCMKVTKCLKIYNYSIICEITKISLKM